MTAQKKVQPRRQAAAAAAVVAGEYARARTANQKATAQTRTANQKATAQTRTVNQKATARTRTADQKATARTRTANQKTTTRTRTANQKATARTHTTDKKIASLTAADRRYQEVLRARILLGGIALAAVVLIAFLLFPRRKPADPGQLVGVSSDVLRYREAVADACRQYGIEEYATLMLAMMQQESSGQGTDVFQCSESPFNTQYNNAPGSITDVSYSIQVGAETFAYCLEQANCSSISDTDALKVALQEYNFGSDYAGWALANYGGYSEENALEFSEKMKAELGWDAYGDPQYVPHVLQYIALG